MRAKELINEVFQKAADERKKKHEKAREGWKGRGLRLLLSRLVIVVVCSSGIVGSGLFIHSH